jgi:hypothetical protein
MRVRKTLMNTKYEPKVGDVVSYRVEDAMSTSCELFNKSTVVEITNYYFADVLKLADGTQICAAAVIPEMTKCNDPMAAISNIILESFKVIKPIYYQLLSEFGDEELALSKLKSMIADTWADDPMLFPIRERSICPIPPKNALKLRVIADPRVPEGEVHIACWYMEDGVQKAERLVVIPVEVDNG